jgi:hypothetical protein
MKTFAFLMHALTAAMLLLAFTAGRPTDTAQVAAYYANLLGFLWSPIVAVPAVLLNLGPYFWPKRR